jgi:hypothetical protein
VNVGGARFSLRPSEQPGYGALCAGQPGPGAEQWKPLGYEVQLLSMNGRSLAMLAVVTIKTDGKAGVWSLCMREHLVADDLPLAAPLARSARALVVQAGENGAMVCELACSDENPLFEDTNDNAVPDDFEQEALGQLLRAEAAPEAKAALVEAWRERQYVLPKQFDFRVPAPDAPTRQQRALSQGEAIHGDPTSIRIDSTLEN